MQVPSSFCPTGDRSERGQGRKACGLLQFVPTVQPFQFTFACGLPQCLSYFPRISIIFNFISFWGCLTQNRPKQWDVMLAFKNDKNIKILMRCKPRTLRSHCVHRNLPWTVHHPKLCRLCSHDLVFPQTRSYIAIQNEMKQSLVPSLFPVLLILTTNSS